MFRILVRSRPSLIEAEERAADAGVELGIADVGVSSHQPQGHLNRHTYVLAGDQGASLCRVKVLSFTDQSQV